MSVRGLRVGANLILVIIIATLVVFTLACEAHAKATPTPKPTHKVTPAPTPTPTPTPVPTPMQNVCTVTGRVVDTHGNGVGGAKVTMYNMTLLDNRVTGMTTIERYPDQNPQYTNGGEGSTVGYYQYFGIPSGLYHIVVDEGGTRYLQNITVTAGAITAQDIIVTASVTATDKPVATAGTSPTSITGPVTSYEPIVTVIPAGPTPVEKQGNDDPLILRLGAGVLIGLQFLAACVVLGLYRIRRS